MIRQFGHDSESLSWQSMKILAISDLHGDLRLARKAAGALRPDLLLCCGDWGDPEQVSQSDLEEFLDITPVLSTFGNHDPLDLLAGLQNRDGSAVLLKQDEVRDYQGLKLAGIGGIWAKSHRLACYVTDDEVARWAATIAANGPVDILVTHGCPIGLADLTPTGRHGGQRCFLEAFRAISPRIHLCGHLHVAQVRELKDGRKVINVGATPQGNMTRIDFDCATRKLTTTSEVNT